MPPFICLQDPYLRLGPFKVEEKNFAPFVGLFHDFMYENESRSYRNAVKDHLFRSQTQGKIKNSSTNIKRTSSQQWLSEFNDLNDLNDTIPIVIKFNKRIKMATRLHTSEDKGSEQYQVANYGIGGVYNHHLDSSGYSRTYSHDVEKLMSGGTNNMDTMGYYMGDRITTSMTYLTDVPAGGATVFPALGVTSWPKRGNMIMWYNNDLNQNSDPLTQHGGCPVLAGSKWITNKWIRAHAQWRNFPCTTRFGRYERLKPLNNDVCKMTDRCNHMDLWEEEYGEARRGIPILRPGLEEAKMRKEMREQMEAGEQGASSA